MDMYATALPASETHPILDVVSRAHGLKHAVRFTRPAWLAIMAATDTPAAQSFLVSHILTTVANAINREPDTDWWGTATAAGVRMAISLRLVDKVPTYTITVSP